MVLSLKVVSNCDRVSKRKRTVLHMTNFFCSGGNTNAVGKDIRMTTMITAISEERCNDSFLYEELSVARPVVAPKHADSINFIAESPEQIFRQNVASRKHAQQLVEATEDIRRHIARELHDDIGQRLSLLSIRLGLLQQLH